MSGTSFDVVWELVGNDGSELVSECVTVTVKLRGTSSSTLRAIPGKHRNALAMAAA